MRKLFAVVLATSILYSCSDTIDDQILVAKNLPLDGTQEVPGKMVAGNGTMDVSYNRGLKTVYYTIKWNSLTGAPTTGFGLYGSAAKGYRAPSIIQSFTGFPAAQAGTYSGTVFIDGVVLKEEDLLSGLYYINVATAANPISAANPAQSGEIRGQITGLH
jgi:hypothetical protein